MNIDSPQNSQIQSLRELWKEAFGDSDEFLDSFFETAYSNRRCRCITEDGKVVAALYWFDCEYANSSVAYIYAVATLKAYRGRGLCGFLMKNTHDHLCSCGYSAVILVPGSPELFDFYEKLGYKTSTYVKKFKCTADDGEIGVTLVSAYEYTELRRKFLPPKSVIQENENIKFLTTMCNFYVGENFLMAAYLKGKTLCVPEFLGDETAAPKIVKFFGCATGEFLTNGEATPFSMSFILDEKYDFNPSYFGLAFE